MGFLRSLWDRLTKVLSKLWSLLTKIAAVVAIIAAIYLLFSGFILYGILLLIAAYLISPETATQVIQATGEAAAGVAEAIGGAAASVTEGFLSGLATSPIGMVAIGVGMFFLLKSGSTSSTQGVVSYVPGDDREADSNLDREELTGDLSGFA